MRFAYKFRLHANGRSSRNQPPESHTGDGVGEKYVYRGPYSDRNPNVGTPSRTDCRSRRFPLP